MRSLTINALILAFQTIKFIFKRQHLDACTSELNGHDVVISVTKTKHINSRGEGRGWLLHMFSTLWILIMDEV